LSMRTQPRARPGKSPRSRFRPRIAGCPFRATGWRCASCPDCAGGGRTSRSDGCCACSSAAGRGGGRSSAQRPELHRCPGRPAFRPRDHGGESASARPQTSGPAGRQGGGQIGRMDAAAQSVWSAKSPPASAAPTSPKPSCSASSRNTGSSPVFQARSSARPPPCPIGFWEGELAHRLDYRAIPTFTIDPDDAKDFDDALSIETDKDGEGQDRRAYRGRFELCPFRNRARPGGAPARQLHLPGRNRHPDAAGKAFQRALLAGRSRGPIVQGGFLIFGKNGRIRETTFANTVIRSRKRLTYRQAYALCLKTISMPSGPPASAPAFRPVRPAGRCGT